MMFEGQVQLLLTVWFWFSPQQHCYSALEKPNGTKVKVHSCLLMTPTDDSRSVSIDQRTNVMMLWNVKRLFVFSCKKQITIGFFFFNRRDYFQGLLEEVQLIYWVLAPPEAAQIAGFMGCNDPYRNTLLPRPTGRLRSTDGTREGQIDVRSLGCQKRRRRRRTRGGGGAWDFNAHASLKSASVDQWPVDQIQITTWGRVFALKKEISR